MTTPVTSEITLACDMSALTSEQRNQHIVTSQHLLNSATAIQELANGYAFQLPAEAQWLHEIATFIAYERLCCPFLQFTVTLEPQSTALWLALTALTTPDDIKLFLRLELGDHLQPNLVQQAGWH